MTAWRKAQDSDGGGRSGVSPEDRVRTLTATVVDGTTAVAEQVRGLSDDEIQRIECDQPAPLADAYRCFLALIGGGAGHFMQGSDVFYPAVIGLGESARELLTENDVPFVLAESDRVILMHQGYQFDFLRGPGPDPEVWSYREGDGPGDVPTLSFTRFTDWLQAHVTQQTEAWARLVPWYEAEKQKRPGDRRVYFSRRHPDGSVSDEL
ncbi:SMI1/KNR4 family protein [Streptomyces sp. NPDC048409]|uniref:SMI1/KNR4 family protein n=1 Tax=Streptomyces sp. NPDC048409 TaxID=3154723 RepID=UPI0034151C50